MFGKKTAALVSLIAQAGNVERLSARTTKPNEF
jgi:hypothetical protein